MSGNRIRTATIMFTDLVDSTSRSERVGPARADVLRRDHFDLVRDAIERFNGVEVKTLGDGVMTAFDSTVDAVNAAVTLQQSIELASRGDPDRPELRVGLSVGEVSEEALDYFGTPVIEAARLCNEAQPRQILCSRVVRQLAETRCDHGFRTLATRTLKGLSRSTEIEEVSWVPILDSGIVADFARVDDQSIAQVATDCLDVQRQRPFMAGLRRQIRESLAPSAGQRLLDIGSGTGDDVVELARLVGGTGSVIGIDKSASLTEEAIRRATAAGVTNVEFRVGKAEHLDLEDQSVDGCRSDRVFQYLADPMRAVQELVRVTRPGGRVVVADTDWGVSVFDTDDLELGQRINRAWCERRASGLVGRQLYGFFVRAGMRDVVVTAHASVATQMDDLFRAYIPGYASQAVDAGATTPEEASRWVALQEAADSQGRFCFLLVMFIVAGSVPD